MFYDNEKEMNVEVPDKGLLKGSLSSVSSVLVNSSSGNFQYDYHDKQFKIECTLKELEYFIKMRNWAGLFYDATGC